MTISLRLLFTVALTLLSQGTNAGVSLHVTSDKPLPRELPAGARPWDVRWASSSEVYLSLGPQGVIRLKLGSAQFSTVMPPGNRGGFFLTSLLARGENHLVGASPFGGFAWVPFQAGARNKLQEKGLANIMDIDARGDRFALLGADSGPLRGLAEDGTIAWTGSFSQDLKVLRPLMKGRATPGGKDMARCAFLETGGIRFMADGSLVVLPGTEPGMYRYDGSGKLLQTWDTAPLGIVDDCAIGDQELAVLARDFAHRSGWLASRTTVDEILPLSKGPALLLRRVAKGVTTFEMLILPFRGKPERVAVPVTVATPRGHVRGDVRGDQLVLLAFDAPLPNQKPGAPTRLIVLSIRQ